MNADDVWTLIRQQLAVNIDAIHLVAWLAERMPPDAQPEALARMKHFQERVEATTASVTAFRERATA